MKRLLPLFLSLILCISLAGCSDTTDRTPQASSKQMTARIMRYIKS